MTRQEKKEFLRGIREVLEERGVDDPEDPRVILAHLERTWPGGLKYNEWYCMHTARKMGVLDAEFRPVSGARFVDERARQIREVAQLGGFSAVVACARTIMGGTP